MAAGLLEASFARLSLEKSGQYPQTRTTRPRPPIETKQITAKESGFSSQQTALCSIAQEHLQKHLQKQRKPLQKLFKGAVQKVDNYKRLAAMDLQKIQKALGLSALELSHLKDDYTEMYRKRFLKMRKLLLQPQTDWKKILVEVRDLFQAQDTFLKDNLGANRHLQFRKAELKSRTGLMAILAQLAGKNWRKDLSW